MTVNISMDDSWERTLMGISKELKRILFLPPGKQVRYVLLLLIIYL